MPVVAAQMLGVYIFRGALMGGCEGWRRKREMLRGAIGVRKRVASHESLVR